jgi:hypothetical protein
MGDRSATRFAGSQVRAPLTQGSPGFALGFILTPTSWAQEQPPKYSQQEIFFNLFSLG